MPHVPKAVCGVCNLEMVPAINGVNLTAVADNDREYFKIVGDKYKCPLCDYTMYTGFALEGITPTDSAFAQIPTDVKFHHLENHDRTPTEIMQSIVSLRELLDKLRNYYNSYVNYRDGSLRKAVRHGNKFVP